MLKLKKKKTKAALDRYASFTLTEQDLSLVVTERGSDGRFVLTATEHTALGVPEDAKEILSDRMARYQLSDSQCSWVLQPKQYQLLQIDDLDVPETELKMAARWRIKDLIDFPLREAAVDIIRIPPHGATGHRRLVYVVATRMSLLQERMALFNSLELPVKVIDVAALALANIMHAIPSAIPNKALLCLQPQGSFLLLTHENVVYLIYRLNFDINEIDLNDPETYPMIATELQRAYEYFASEMGFTDAVQLLLTPVLHDNFALLNYFDQQSAIPALLADTNQILPSSLSPSTDLQVLTYSAFGGVLRFTRGNHVARS